jgi:hypothetical protein
MARWVGERADENTYRTRLATVYFATAAAAGSLALSGAIAGIAIPAGAGRLLGLGAAALKASAAGAVGAGGFDMGMQAARMIDDANAEFSWDEVLSSVEQGAKFGPAMALRYVPVMAATLGALQGGAEIAKGNVAQGVATAAGSLGLARLLGRGARPGGGHPAGEAAGPRSPRDAMREGTLERVGKFFNVYPNAAKPGRQRVLQERYEAAGKSPEEAAILAKAPRLAGPGKKPRGGESMGHHWIPRDKINAWVRALRGKPLGEPAAKTLEWFKESPFNRLFPRGISKGEWERLHMKVDPRYSGGKAGPFRFSREGEGVKAYGRAGRLWFGTPNPTKVVVAGGVAGTGIAVHEVLSDDGDDSAVSPPGGR